MASTSYLLTMSAMTLTVCPIDSGSPGSHSVGIEPGVELHSPGVALIDHKLERIPERIGCYALFAGEEPGPRLQVGGIEGIGLGTYLENDSIAAVGLQFIKCGREPLLNLFARQVLYLLVAYDVQPGSAEFALRKFPGERRSTGSKQDRQGKE